jgi:hypothetical protein
VSSATASTNSKQGGDLPQVVLDAGKLALSIRGLPAQDCGGIDRFSHVRSEGRVDELAPLLRDPKLLAEQPERRPRRAARAASA